MTGGRKLGDNIGGIRSMDDLMGRCVVTDGDDCWHLRQADGKPYPRHVAHKVWIHSVGSVAVPRAVMLLKHGKMPAKNMVCYRGCGTYDCANPDHIESTPRSHWPKRMRELNLIDATRSRLACIRVASMMSKLSIDERRWIQESELPSSDIAKSLGLSDSYIRRVRRRDRQRFIGQTP